MGMGVISTGGVSKPFDTLDPNSRTAASPRRGSCTLDPSHLESLPKITSCRLRNASHPAAAGVLSLPSCYGQIRRIASQPESFPGCPRWQHPPRCEAQGLPGHPPSTTLPPQLVPAPSGPMGPAPRAQGARCRGGCPAGSGTGVGGASRTPCAWLGRPSFPGNLSAQMGAP